MNQRWADLLLIYLLLLAWLAALLTGALPTVQLLSGAFIICLAPGYLWTTAAFYRADDLDHIERMGMSVGISIALAPLLAFILNMVGFSLTLSTIMGAELVGILVATAIICVQRWQLWENLYLPQITMGHVTIAAVTLGTLAISAQLVSNTLAETTYTEFYLLVEESAENYPQQATLDEPIAVTMTIANYEATQHTYRVEGWVFDGYDQIQVLQRDDIVIAANDQFSDTLSWLMPKTGADQQVMFYLFIDNIEQPYRQARLWIDVNP